MISIVAHCFEGLPARQPYAKNVLRGFPRQFSLWKPVKLYMQCSVDEDDLSARGLCSQLQRNEQSYQETDKINVRHNKTFRKEKIREYIKQKTIAVFDVWLIALSAVSRLCTVPVFSVTKCVKCFQCFNFVLSGFEKNNIKYRVSCAVLLTCFAHTDRQGTEASSFPTLWNCFDADELHKLQSCNHNPWPIYAYSLYTSSPMGGNHSSLPG